MPLDIMLAQLSNIHVVSFDCDYTLPTLLDVPFVLSVFGAAARSLPAGGRYVLVLLSATLGFVLPLSFSRMSLRSLASLCAAGPISIKTQWSQVLDGTWEMF